MHILSLGSGSPCRGKYASKKSKDLHIRKVSFSGSSLSSASDASTITYTPRSTIYTPKRSRSDSVSTGYTYTTRRSQETSRSLSPQHAPLRLRDRPLLRSETDVTHHHQWHHTNDDATFFDDNISDDEIEKEDEALFFGAADGDYELSVSKPFHSHRFTTITTEDSDDDDDLNEITPNHDRNSTAPSFFTLDLPSRRPALCSRWSDSTIQTLDTLSRTTSTTNLSVMATTEEAEDYEEATTDSEEQVAEKEGLVLVTRATMPNFSYKRATVPKRPPMKAADSLEDFIKRGGWKRRGIVFQKEEMGCDDAATETDFEIVESATRSRNNTI